jgi:hypothetical protein
MGSEEEAHRRDKGQCIMRAAMTQLNLSARADHRILKLARTIADLVGCEEIQSVQRKVLTAGGVGKTPLPTKTIAGRRSPYPQVRPCPLHPVKGATRFFENSFNIFLPFA